ncbi:MAG: ABC transporter permease [bacterium]
MRRFLINRIFQLVPLLIGISLISFFVMHLAPGDPTSLFIDPNVRPEELARVRANWGLDQPVYIQYFLWLKNAIFLDFGKSYTTGQPVIAEIAAKLPMTLMLMIPAFILMLLITIPIGVISAVKKGSWFDNIFTFLSFAGMAIPTFWLGLMLMLVFSVKLHWFPAVGNIILPLITMTIGSLAGMTRYQRAAMLEVLNQDFIRTARAKGLPERVVIYKHALRNALIPIITILGLSLPDLFGGAFIIETIFAWPGMGRLGVQSIFQRNYPMIMGIVMFSAFLIILGNLFADLAYALVDPRIRLKGQKEER